MTTTAIDVRGLRKSYGDKTVLDDVDLTVRAGTVTALLGPNGAGKTTAVHILATLLARVAPRVDQGQQRVLVDTTERQHGVPDDRHGTGRRGFDVFESCDVAIVLIADHQRDRHTAGSHTSPFREPHSMRR